MERNRGSTVVEMGFGSTIAVGDTYRHTPDSSGKRLCAAQSLERIAGIGPKNGMILLFLLGNCVLKIPKAPEERYHNRNGIFRFGFELQRSDTIGFCILSSYVSS